MDRDCPMCKGKKVLTFNGPVIWILVDRLHKRKVVSKNGPTTIPCPLCLKRQRFWELK